MIAAFASGAVAAVVAGTATFAAYATVAGAVLSVAGAISGNKDLSRIGAIVGIAGGISSLAEGASGAAASTSTSIDEAAKAGDYVNSADAASDAAGAATAPTAAPGGGNLVDPSMSQATSIADKAAQTAGTAPNPASPASPSAAPAVPATDAVTGTTGTPSPTGIMDKAVQNTGLQAPNSTDYMGPGSPGAGAGTDNIGTNPNSIQTLSKQYTSGDLNDWWNKVKSAGQGVSSYLKDNKEVVSLAGKALESMYGPQAEQLDYTKSLMERARNNLNTPVPLRFNKPVGG